MGKDSYTSDDGTAQHGPGTSARQRQARFVINVAFGAALAVVTVVAFVVGRQAGEEQLSLTTGIIRGFSCTVPLFLAAGECMRHGYRRRTVVLGAAACIALLVLSFVVLPLLLPA